VLSAYLRVEVIFRPVESGGEAGREGRNWRAGGDRPHSAENRPAQLINRQ
jgi:hypothetical protein